MHALLGHIVIGNYKLIECLARGASVCGNVAETERIRVITVISP